MDYSSHRVEDLPILGVGDQEIPGQRPRLDEVIILKMSHKITNRATKDLDQSFFWR